MERPQKFIQTFVSVDCVVVGFDNEQLNILLVKREVGLGETRFLKLPGSLIYDNEDINDAAIRVLYELTGIKKLSLRQFRCFASPDRASNLEDMKWLDKAYQPNINRLITVANIALCKIDRKLNNTSRYNTQWCPLNQLPEMPFDHNLIVQESLTEIRRWIDSDPSIVFEILPTKFTFRQLHRLYEAIYAKKIDIRNFHKRTTSMSYIIALDEKEKNVPHRAAQYYRFNMKEYKKLKTNL